MIHHFFEHHAFGETKVHLQQTTALAKTKTALCGGKAQPGGGGWNVLFDVNKAARLALRLYIQPYTQIVPWLPLLDVLLQL